MRRHLSSAELTTSGKWAFFIALLFIFSISVEYRVVIVGLLVHPYLLLLPLAVLFARVGLLELPKSVLTPMMLFYALFFLASLRNNQPFSEISKVLASLITFLFFATAVKTEKDFRTVCWGFIVCALAIGIRGFLISETDAVSRLSGINALEGLGNKNAQSLFTLPAIFLGLILFLKYNAAKNIMRLVPLLGALFFILINVFLSANRSGWVGLAIIGVVFIFYNGVSMRSVILSLTLGGLVYFAIDRFASDIVEHKREQTVEGYASDVGRQRLALQAFEVGMENALFGVGMDELHRQMALRLGVTQRGIELMDTHILWGYLFGATGFFSLLMFVLFLLSLTKKMYRFNEPGLARYVGKTRFLMIGFVLLFITRALFTREILYSPTFMGAMGLLFGYYLMQIRHAQSIHRA